MRHDVAFFAFGHMSFHTTQRAEGKHSKQ
jgi:hypothetical protein